ncbi:MAG TPA: sxtJ [Gammaproteobacteria bacterium]|nr:sxtJ [Gammaproteobacteria bacterium]|tara:strand:+ start:21 stop:425 length:405 start_codon:yes stop_codon:yes gene_type:complete
MLEIKQLGRNELRNFGIVTGTILGVLFGLFFPWAFDLAVPIWPWVLGGLFAAWGLIAPMTLTPTYRGWMRFGILLNHITTPLVLGFVFFTMIAPLGFVMRRFGWDPMARKINDRSVSYRVPSSKVGKDRFERPF